MYTAAIENPTLISATPVFPVQLFAAPVDKPPLLGGGVGVSGDRMRNRGTTLYAEDYCSIFEKIYCVPCLFLRRPPRDIFCPFAVYGDVDDIILPSECVLQSSSLHSLGQGFAKLYGVQFCGREGERPQESELERKRQEKAMKGGQKAKEKEERMKANLAKETPHRRRTEEKAGDTANLLKHVAIVFIPHRFDRHFS